MPSKGVFLRLLAACCCCYCLLLLKCVAHPWTLRRGVKPQQGKPSSVKIAFKCVITCSGVAVSYLPFFLRVVCKLLVPSSRALFGSQPPLDLHILVLAESQLIGGHTSYFVLCGLGVSTLGSPWAAARNQRWYIFCAHCKSGIGAEIILPSLGPHKLFCGNVVQSSFTVKESKHFSAIMPLLQCASNMYNL